MEEKKINETDLISEEEKVDAEVTAEENTEAETTAEEVVSEEKECETDNEKEESGDTDASAAEEVTEVENKKKSIMMKKLKPIIITAIACVVVAGLAVGAYYLFPQRENAPDFAPAAENEEVKISDKSAKMVESIEVEPADGEDFEIVYSTDTEGNQIGTVKGAGGEFKYKSSELYTLAGYVAYILAIEEIQDPQGRDDEFGFDEPKQKLQINFKGNQKLELILGGNAPSGDGIYLKRADTGRVYLIGGSTAQMLMMSLLDYRDISLYEPYSTIYEINELSVQRPDEEKITVRRKEGVQTNADGSVANETEALYEVVSPDKADADNVIVEEDFLTPFLSITADSLVEDHPKDLAKYGLDNPTIIEVKDKYGKTHTIKVGDTDDRGGHYVMCDDVPSVVATAEPISFLNIKHTDFMMKLIWRYNYSDVKQVQFTMPGGVAHTLEISKAGASFNGTTTTQDNAVNLFMHAIQFEIQDSITKDMTYGNANYKIVITRIDGSSSTLELAPINERYYAASLNGEKARYYVNVGQVNALAEAVNALASGGVVPSIF